MRLLWKISAKNKIWIEAVGFKSFIYNSPASKTNYISYKILAYGEMLKMFSKNCLLN